MKPYKRKNIRNKNDEKLLLKKQKIKEEIAEREKIIEILENTVLK